MIEEPHFVDGMSNYTYHNNSPGIGSSSLKEFIESPAQYIWSQNCPRDESKMSAIDFGTHFHTYFLEPNEFKKHYKVLPVFNRRKADEKQAELDLIKEWKASGIVAVAAEDMDKLEAMRRSAMAHPVVEHLMAMSGIAERSFFWHDELGVDCRCRPDWLINEINDNNRETFMWDECTSLIMDLKTIGQIDRVQSQIENLKYFVQDAFYRRGVSKVIQQKVDFLFVFVSTTLSMGRYPVEIIRLKPTAVLDGRMMVEDGLKQFANKSAVSDWLTVKELDRPSWATMGDVL